MCTPHAPRPHPAPNPCCPLHPCARSSPVPYPPVAPAATPEAIVRAATLESGRRTEQTCARPSRLVPGPEPEAAPALVTMRISFAHAYTDPRTLRPVTHSRLEERLLNTRGRTEVTTLEAREATRPLAGERQKSRVALVTVGTRGVGTAVGRSLACKPD